MESAAVMTKEGPLPAPCMDAVIVPIESVRTSTWNPGVMPERQMKLLEKNIREFGFCSPLLVTYDADAELYTIIDGEERFIVMRDRLQAAEVPVVVIDATPTECMTAAVRFNRARSVPQAERMGELIDRLNDAGMRDDEISSAIGMSMEELMRLKQISGVAAYFTDEPYSRAWDVHHDEAKIKI